MLSVIDGRDLLTTDLNNGFPRFTMEIANGYAEGIDSWHEARTRLAIGVHEIVEAEVELTVPILHGMSISNVHDIRGIAGFVVGCLQKPVLDSHAGPLQDISARLLTDSSAVVRRSIARSLTDLHDGHTISTSFFFDVFKLAHKTTTQIEF